MNIYIIIGVVLCVLGFIGLLLVRPIFEKKKRKIEEEMTSKKR